MTKQVPSKHDTTRTVISILPLATFHQWLIKLVDCSTLCANLTLVSLFLFFFFFLNLTPVQTVTETDIVLKQWCVFVCEWMTGLTFFFFFFWMYLLRKNQSTLYGTFTVLHFQYSWTCITWLFHCFSVGKRPGGWVELHGLDHYSS